METIFTKIIKREVPGTIVFEDDLSIAILDINPVAKGHVLLITKEPYPWMTDAPEDVVGEVFIRAQRIIKALKAALSCDYVQVSVVGKDVPHFHIHLIPQNLTDRDLHMDHTHYENDDEKESYGERIRSAISS